MHKIQRAKKKSDNSKGGDSIVARTECSSTRAHTDTFLHTYRADGGKHDEMDALVRIWKVVVLIVTVWTR